MMTIPRSLVTKFAENKELSREKLRKRLDLGTSRPDFIDAMIRKSESAGAVSLRRIIGWYGKLVLIIYRR